MLLCELFQNKTLSPEFYAWFGDSKAVNADGSPMILYHGTSKDQDFKHFSIPKSGAWFATSPKDGSDYAQQNDSQNLVYDHMTGKYVHKHTASRVIPVYLKINNPKIYEGYPQQEIGHTQNYKKALGILFDKLRSQGYDSMIITHQGKPSVVALLVNDPSRIKSAISNKDYTHKKNIHEETIGDKISESIGAQPKYLYHATKQSNVDSIMQNGLQTKYYGAVHGSMDIHPPLPAIYLSRKPASDNLNSNMWTEPAVVLKIDFAQLDTDQMWPDDFIYDAFANEEILTTPNSVMKALGVDKATAVNIFEQLTNASDEQLPELLKPFWFWYLTHRKGGEVAYTADIPPTAIVAQRPHPFNSQLNSQLNNLNENAHQPTTFSKEAVIEAIRSCQKKFGEGFLYHGNCGSFAIALSKWMAERFTNVKVGLLAPIVVFNFDGDEALISENAVDYNHVFSLVSLNGKYILFDGSGEVTKQGLLRWHKDTMDWYEECGFDSGPGEGRVINAIGDIHSEAVVSCVECGTDPMMDWTDFYEFLNTGKLTEDSDVRYQNDGIFHDPDNKVVRDKGAWGASHSNSFAITGKSAAIIGADGYKDHEPDTHTLKTLAIKKLTAIANSAGSKEPLYHGFQNRRRVGWQVGSILTIPLTATSGDLQSSAGYGTRIDPNDNEGPPTVFEFPKGTKICGYSKWAKEDAEDFGHLWSEAIVAGKFRILNVRQVRYDGTWRNDVFITVVRLEPVEYFNPETGKWMPAGKKSSSLTEGQLPRIMLSHEHYDSLDEPDEYVYHVTLEPLAQRIIQQGFMPNRRPTMTNYSGYSKGKVFFTERSGVSFWEERVEQHAENNMDDPPPVAVLRVPKEEIGSLLQPDPVGTRDSHASCYFITEPFKPTN